MARLKARSLCVWHMMVYDGKVVYEVYEGEVAI